MIQLLYTQGEGNTQRMAEAITEILPDGQWRKEMILPDTSLIPADFSIVGFGIRRNAPPYTVLSLLDQMENQRVAFFASGALGGAEAYKTHIVSQLLSFLPDSSRYEGLFLCSGELSQAGQTYFEDHLGGNDAVMRQMLVQTLRHPDAEDMNRLRQFILQIL